jgi:hypothetical protein
MNNKMNGNILQIDNNLALEKVLEINGAFKRLQIRRT